MSTAAMVGTTLASTYLSSRASSKAAKAQAGAAGRAAQLQYQQFQDTKDVLNPFVEGASGAYQLQQAQSGALGPEAQAAAFKGYKESPGVAWQREQGMRGLNQNLAATGVGGGGRLKAISDYNQGLAMQDFSNQFNRLGATTGVGLNAAQALTGAGATSAAGQAQSIMAGGAARASGTLGRSAAFSSGVQSLGNIYAMNKMGAFK